MPNDFGSRAVDRPHTWRDTLVLLSPLLVLLVFVSANSGINRHLRYMLPIFPFAFIWVSQVARGMSVGHVVLRRGFTACVAVAMLWFVTASLSVFPHSGSYFNELAGGPRNGHAHLVCSNIDWGQDLLFLKRWYDAHPEARPFRLAYYGAVDPRHAGIAFTAPPVGPHPDGRLAEVRYQEEPGPIPGWHAVSVHILAGSPTLIPDGTGKRRQLDVHDYSYFRRFEPVAMAGYSLAIYHISVADAERVRRELGLPPWSERSGELTARRASTGGEL